MVLECQHAESLHLSVAQNFGDRQEKNKPENILREKPHVWGLFIAS